MRQRSKVIFISLFILTIVYTCYGILQLGRHGGPCNGGLAIIVLTPFVLICVGLLTVSFSLLSNQKKTELAKPILLVIISLCVWTFVSITFLEDSIKESILYLGPLEALNICLAGVLIKQNKIHKANKI